MLQYLFHLTTNLYIHNSFKLFLLFVLDNSDGFIISIFNSDNNFVRVSITFNFLVKSFGDYLTLIHVHGLTVSIKHIDFAVNKVVYGIKSLDGG